MESDLIESGLLSIQESLYGPESSESFDEACRFFTDFMISSNAFLESSMLEINKILSKANSYRETYIQNLKEAAEVYQEGLINFKIDSIESLKQAIDTVDATPKMVNWMVGVTKVCCYLYRFTVTVTSGIPLMTAVLQGGLTVATGLGLGIITALVTKGAIYFGKQLLEWIITKIYNKITYSKALTPREITTAVKSIIASTADLEVQLRKEKAMAKAAEVAQMRKYLEEEYTIYLKKINFLG